MISAMENHFEVAVAAFPKYPNQYAIILSSKLKRRNIFVFHFPSQLTSMTQVDFDLTAPNS